MALYDYGSPTSKVILLGTDEDNLYLKLFSASSKQGSEEGHWEKTTYNDGISLFKPYYLFVSFEWGIDTSGFLSFFHREYSGAT